MSVSAIAGGTLALPRAFGTTLLPRALGIYIAACAGGVQLLDIMVERLQLDDRVFTFAIVLAAIGVPFVAAVALLVETARAERRRPQPVPTGAAYHGAAAVATARPFDRSSPPPGAADIEIAHLQARLELALSYYRMAALQDGSAGSDERSAHRARGARELEQLIVELRRLIDAHA